MSVCHGGNSDDLVSISAMTGTVAVNFCVYFNGLYNKKKKKKCPCNPKIQAVDRPSHWTAE